MRVWALSLLFVLGCETDPLGPLPAEMPLRCGSDPLTAPTLVDQGSINLRSSGPCGDIVYQRFNAGVSAQTLVTPGQEPVVLTGQPQGFSPSGDLLAIAGARGQVYDTATGDTYDLYEGFGAIHFLRDDGDPPRTYAVGCGEDEVRILDPDGSVRTLAEDVVSCPTIAPHAPILLYQDGDGRLHRLDVASGDDLLLEDILYSDGTTTFPGSGRNDLLVLSSDGEVVVHHQRTWGGGREWATLTRTTDGQVLGAIPDARGRFLAQAIPGGHVMVMSTAEYLWVLSQDFEFFAYEGLTSQGLVGERELVVWSEPYRELFLFEPVTGFRSEPIFVDETEVSGVPRVQRSENGRFFVAESTFRCESAQCATVVLHDVALETSIVLFEGEGRANTRHVTDDGVVLVEGTFRRVASGTFDNDVRLYGPDGAMRATIDNRNIGRTAARGRSIYIQTYDPMFGTTRLDRIDTETGEVARVIDDLSDFRLAGDRIYYLGQFDMMGMAELFAAPIE